MRRLVIQNALLAMLLVFIILISSINAEAAIISAPQVVISNAAKNSDYFTITGCPNSVTAGQSFSGITVTVYNANGNIKTGYKGTVHFTSTDPKATLPYTSQNPYTFTTGKKGDKGVHTFSGFNLATAGSQTITITDGSISATTSAVKVNPAIPIKIQIAPKTTTITAGSNQAYTATATDYYGNSWDVTALTSWSITAGAYGSWSSNVYTSAQTGTWTVTGGYSGLYDSASLTVNHATATSITINPKTASVTAGSSQIYTVSASDVYGNSWDVTGSASWSISYGGGGSWSNNVYTSAKVGTWTVTVKMGSLSDTAFLTVVHASAVNFAISPKNPAVIAGHSQIFTATACDIYGNSWDATGSTVWVIDSGAGGSWVGNVYTSAKAGTWTITGVYRGLSDTASLTVIPAAPISITLSPKTANLAAGFSQSYSAAASDVYGNSWDVTGSAVWSISSGAGGSWSGGVYTSATAGTWKITGVFGGLSDTASLTVTHGYAVKIEANPKTATTVAGSTQAFTAIAFDPFGNSWDSTSSASFGVDLEAGGSLSGNLYTSSNAGTWTLTVISLGLSGTASLIVTHASPVGITVGPNFASITAGSSQAYTATASDSYGNVWDVTDLTVWSASSGAEGFWNSNQYTSAITGSWTITGAYSGLSDYAYLTVNHASAVSVNVSPKTAIITAGSNETFAATASDLYGNTWDVSNSASWAVTSGAGGSWTGNTYTSANAGNWIATATINSLSDTASLTVNHGSALSLTVSPASTSLIAGSTQTFTATASDSNGNTWDVTNSTSWSIDGGAGGSWLSNVYNSFSAGNWTVTGIYSGISSTASLTVNHGPAVNITVGPTSDSIMAGSTETFTATASDLYGNTWDVTGSTVWSIDSGAGGSWSANVYTSELAGVWNVTGTLGGLSKSVFLTVTHASAVSIQINPYSATIAAGSNEAFTTTAVDSFGNTWDVTSLASYSISPDAGGSWSANVYASAKTGTWNVTAILASFSATVPVTVNYGSVTSIAISPKTQTIDAGSTQSFIATASDAYGNFWEVTSSTVWIIDSGAGGSWSGNIYTSANAGNWIVTGVLNGLTDKASLTVNHGSISSIIVSPASASITAGSDQSYTATAYDSTGNTWDVTNAVSWLTSAGDGGSWTGNVYTASNPGSWTVTASSNGASGTAQLAVNNIQPLEQFSPVDFYYTGTVGFIDVVYFLDGYIQYYQTGAINPACDLNHDGKMDFQDIVIFLDDYNAALAAAYGPANTPSP